MALSLSFFGCKVSSISKKQEKEYLHILYFMQQHNMTDYETRNEHNYPTELVNTIKINDLYAVYITYPDSVIYFSKNKTFTIEGYAYVFSKQDSVIETYEDTGDGRRCWHIKDRWYYAVASPW